MALRHAEILQMHVPLALGLWVHRPGPESSLVVTLMFFLHLHSNYATNDLGDRGGDLLNPRRGELAPLQLLRPWALISGVGALGVAAWLGPLALATMIGLTLLQLAYSLPPLRLKGRAPWSLLIHVVVGGVYYGLPVLLLSQWGRVDTLLCLFFAGLLGAASLLNETVDLESDRREGLKTLVMRLGVKHSTRLTALMHLVAAGAALTLVLTQVGVPGLALMILPLGVYLFGGVNLRWRARLAFSLVILALGGVTL